MQRTHFRRSLPLAPISCEKRLMKARIHTRFGRRIFHALFLTVLSTITLPTANAESFDKLLRNLKKQGVPQRIEHRIVGVRHLPAQREHRTPIEGALTHEEIASNVGEVIAPITLNEKTSGGEQWDQCTNGALTEILSLSDLLQSS